MSNELIPEKQDRKIWAAGIVLFCLFIGFAAGYMLGFSEGEVRAYERISGLTVAGAGDGHISSRHSGLDPVSSTGQAPESSDFKNGKVGN